MSSDDKKWEKVVGAGGDDDRPKPPPLGIEPWHLHDEGRVREIVDALIRYNKAGVGPPTEWLLELKHLVEMHGLARRF